ncbi:CREB3 protein, partial [Chunga burmeisteri]|nr:CREB3 protein [Chunga burmeisteri]
MSYPEELAVLADGDLLDFLLKDDAPCPEIPGEENGLLEDWDMPDPELLDKEVDDFISSLLSPVKDEPAMLQGYSPADYDSGISEHQPLSQSPGSNFSSSPWSSDVVQVDHNYSLHWDCPTLANVMSDMAGGDVSADIGNFPVAVDAGPQVVPGATMQVLTALSSDFPELVLTGEEMQLLEREGVLLPTCLPLTEGNWPLKKVRRKVRNKQSCRDSRRRRRVYVGGVESSVAAYIAENHKLEKKVQLLQKRNTSLLKQLRKLRALVKESTAITTTAETHTMVVVLSFCLVLSPSICSSESGEPQLQLRAGSTSLAVLPQQIHGFPNQVVPEVQENAVLEGFSPEPENQLLLGCLSQSQKEEQSPPDADPGSSFNSPPNADPRSSFNNNLSPDPPAAVACELAPLEPQTHWSQVDPLQPEVLVVWKTNRQEQVEDSAMVVIKQACANEM